jgi:phosphoribosylamine-glycine ligase
VNKHAVCWHDLRGIILTETGSKALGYNARLGDPGAQTLLHLLKSDLAEIVVACVERRLHETKVEMHDKFFAVVIISA